MTNEEMAARILELEARVEELEAIAGIDEMTGVLRRSAGEAKLRNLMEATIGRSNFFSLAIVDIDFFKRVNDTYGHPVGDIVIKELARCLREVTRKQDTKFRLGGEEFVVIFENTSAIEAARIMQEVSDAFAAIVFSANNETFSKTISAGVTSSLSHKTYEAVYEVADKALYHSKENGRNQITLY